MNVNMISDMISNEASIDAANDAPNRAANDAPVEASLDAGRPTTASCCGSTAGDALSDAEATELATSLKALADPIRVRLVSIVATSPTGEVCACDLPETLDRSQPTVSHHLGLLVGAGVLEREQRGKWAWFRLRRERLAELAQLLAPPTDPIERPGSDVVPVAPDSPVAPETNGPR